MGSIVSKRWSPKVAVLTSLLLGLCATICLPPQAMAELTAPGSGGLEPAGNRLPLKGLGSPMPEPGKDSLDEIRIGSEQSSGAIFVQPDQVLVKQPLLKALIQLDSQLTPYQLDAFGQPPRAISLRDAASLALENNLDIKISQSSSGSSQWQYRSALGGFLPSLTNGLSYQGLIGKYASPFGLLARVDNSNLVMPSEISYYFFQGGKVLYTALQTKHQYKASQFALKGTTNDVLYEAGKLYYDLALNDVLLQIRVKAVETSEALLARDLVRYENGASTKLDVLQARTQLAKDRQALVSQQIARRQSAIHLATALNLDAGTDLVIQDRLLSKIRLIDPQMSIGDLLKMAVENRPELKQYEQLRLAAKDAIKVARAPLFPTVQGTAVAASTGARVSGGGSSGSQSAATTSGASVGGFSVSTASPTGSSSSTGVTKFTQTEIFVAGIAINWDLTGFGTVAAANTLAAKWQARKALLECNRKLSLVYEEVRDAYLDSIEADNLIKETTDAVESAREQLNVATVRMEEGVGTDLDVVNAQRDYTGALIDKAKALIKFNVAQVSILRTIGKISLDTVTRNVPLGPKG